MFKLKSKLSEKYSVVLHGNYLFYYYTEACSKTIVAESHVRILMSVEGNFD